MFQNPPEIPDKPNKEMIIGQLNNKFGQFTEVEFDAVQKKKWK